MKIVEINTVDYGSTGKIMLQIAECARSCGHQVQTYSVARKGKFAPTEGHTYYSSYFDYCIHYVLARMTGCNGLLSIRATKRLINELEKIKPDIIHLHNLHGFSINLPLVFGYLKKRNQRVIWTFHDCWPFTGKCPYFDAAKCDKWKTGCHRCSQIKGYPQSLIDNTKRMYQWKKNWFGGGERMILVTPSEWLSKLVKESFLQNYPVRVINNGVDLSVFRPSQSEFREKYKIPKWKPIVLGVAFGWGYRKGLDVFLRMVDSLGNDYQIVLVGTDEKVDARLPDNIISIHRTSSQRELAEIYTAADVFVNPTREDNFPTVNMEALACGTPVITFQTGGSPEIIDETCGSVVTCDDEESLKAEIIHVCKDKPYSHEACIQRAQRYNQIERFKEYVKLYEDYAHRS